MDMGNNLKIIFSLAIAKDLTSRAKFNILGYYNLCINFVMQQTQFVTRLRISIIMVPDNSASCNITNKWSASYANKKTLYLDAFRVIYRPGP